MTAQRTDDGPDTIWHRQPPANRGRDGLLDADGIAAVAVAVADAEGLAAASVKRAATRLRVPANRLENYVGSRDELHDLMLDHLLGRITLPAGDLPWRTQLEQLARELYRLGHDHRCLVDLIGARSPSGPHGLRFVEHALASFAATDGDVRVAALSFNSLLSFVCGAVRFETRPGGSVRRSDTASSADYLAQVVATEEFPWLRALFDGAADMTAEESFEHGLRCLLDGIAGRVAAEGTGPSTSP